MSSRNIDTTLFNFENGIPFRLVHAGQTVSVGLTAHQITARRAAFLTLILRNWVSQTLAGTSGVCVDTAFRLAHPRIQEVEHSQLKSHFQAMLVNDA